MKYSFSVARVTMIMLLPVPWIRIMYVRNMIPLYAHRGHGHGGCEGRRREYFKSLWWKDTWNRFTLSSYSSSLIIIFFFWGVFFFFYFFSLRFLTTTHHRLQSSSSSALAIRILQTTAIPQPCSYSCPFFRPCWRWWYPARAFQRRHKGALLSGTVAEDEQEWVHTQSVAEELTARLCTLQRAAEEQGSDNEGLTFRNGIHHPLLTHMYNVAAGGGWGGQGWQKTGTEESKGTSWRRSLEFALGYNNWRWDGMGSQICVVNVESEHDYVVHEHCRCRGGGNQHHQWQKKNVSQAWCKWQLWTSKSGAGVESRCLNRRWI